MPRLPEMFERDQLPAAHQHVYDYLVKARGKVSNGYAPHLHSPELVQRVAHLGTFIRFESSLPEKMYELLAFTTSAELDNPYEADNHDKLTAQLGISQVTRDAILSKSDLAGVSEEDALPVRCARELVREHRLSDSSFAAAHKVLGNKGVVDLIGTIGFYSLLACMHNAMQVRGPA